ncbi:VWA domain-containing protein [Rhodococcus sp. TAF43]|uniref:vWA domain-containing protein n=1 Tax=unclassified Rhodococcus (in: high G+C Gram-positive bacteria) TaxID=192944 RepID=UPI003D22AFDE
MGAWGPGSGGREVVSVSGWDFSWLDGRATEERPSWGTGTGSDEAEKATGCRDIQVLHKVDTLDRDALGSAVDGVKESGWTPMMGNALREAAAAMPSSGPRSIVLVSDGEYNCSPPDPCEVARELKTQGVDSVMHAIGFAVDSAARAQLTCMAQVTGAPTPTQRTDRLWNEFDHGRHDRSRRSSGRSVRYRRLARDAFAPQVVRCGQLRFGGKCSRALLSWMC